MKNQIKKIILSRTRLIAQIYVGVYVRVCLGICLGICLSVFITACANTPVNQGSGFQVNPFLWRASLDAISSMPLASANPQSGIINSEWFEQTSDERFKITIYILDRALRADALRIALFRQVKKQGQWENAAAKKNLAIAIENLILTKARSLRLSYEATQ